MAAINFPNSPDIDELFSVGNRTWKWNGTVWQTVTTPTGSQGDKAGHRYEFSDNTTVSQPADGAIKFNNSSATAVTTISVSNETKTGIDITNFLNDLDNVDSVTKFYLTISSNDNNDPTFTVFRVGDVTVNSEWTELSVLHISGTTPSNGEQVVLNYDRTGDRGPTGPTGAVGPTGPNSLPSYTGNDGKFLTTDGLDAFWENVDALPLQTGNSGKYLTTDGTDPSWEFLAGAVYQDLEPTGPLVGQIWVDSDASASVLNQNDYLLKTDAAVTYLTPIEATGTFLSQTAAASTYLTSTAASSTYLTQTNAASTYAPVVPTTATGFRNVLVNGGFDIWQRGTSGSSSGGAIYSDMWHQYTDTGSGTQSRDLAVTVPGVAMQSYKFTVGGSSAANFSLWQIIESANCSHLVNQTVTLSFYAQVSTARNINVTMALATTADAVWTGTWTTFSTTSVAVGTSMARYTVTTTVPSNMKTMNIGFGSGGTNFAAGTTLNITGVQLELGSLATPFEKRSIANEISLCKRYYTNDMGNASGITFGTLASDGNRSRGVIYFTGGNGEGGTTVRFPQEMRTTPALNIASWTTQTNNVVKGTNFTTHRPGIGDFTSTCDGIGPMGFNVITGGSGKLFFQYEASAEL
jgi:hypothetical protein